MYEFYLFMQFNIDVYDLFNLIVTKNSGERNLAWRKSRGNSPKMRIIIWKARVIQVNHIFIAYSDRTHYLECMHILNIKNTFIYQKIGVKKLSDP